MHPHCTDILFRHMPVIGAQIYTQLCILPLVQYAQAHAQLCSVYISCTVLCIPPPLGGAQHAQHTLDSTNRIPPLQPYLLSKIGHLSGGYTYGEQLYLSWLRLPWLSPAAPSDGVISLPFLGISLDRGTRHPPIRWAYAPVAAYAASRKDIVYLGRYVFGGSRASPCWTQTGSKEGVR